MAGGVVSVAYSPDGASIVTASFDMSVKIWDAATGECRLTLAGHGDGVRSAAYSPQGVASVAGCRSNLDRPTKRGRTLDAKVSCAA